MRRYVKKTTLFGLLVAPFICLPALAIDPGWYGNVGIGVSDYSEKELTDVCDAVGIPCEVDNMPTNFRFGIGHKFNPYLSLEGGYMSLGEMNYSVLGIDAVSFSAKGPYASLLAELPIGGGSFSLLGSAGAAFLEGELGTTPLLGGINVLNEQGGVPFVGAGAAINSSTGRFGVRFMWERIDLSQTYELKGRDIDAPGIDLFTLSAIFRLGK